MNFFNLKRKVKKGSFKPVIMYITTGILVFLVSYLIGKFLYEGCPDNYNDENVPPEYVQTEELFKKRSLDDCQF